MRHEKAKTLAIITLLALFSIAALGQTPHTHAAGSASQASSEAFTLVVSRFGFNGTNNTVVLSVHQGDSVNITFIYGDNDLATDNPHVIAIEGYAIQSATISKANPTATIQFVADQTGEFKIYCNLPCKGMANLQAGLLSVASPQGSRIPTILNVTANSESPDFLIQATVKESNGLPLADVPVKLYENTSLGEMWIHTMVTNAQGEITHDYAPSRSGPVEIIADYPGNLTFANSSNIVSFMVSSPASGTPLTGPAYYGLLFPPNFAMIGVSTMLNIVVVAVVSIVLLSVWSNLLYVVREILSLPKRGSSSAERIRKAGNPAGLARPFESEPAPNPIRRGADLSRTGFTILLASPLFGLLDVFLANGSGLSLVAEGALVVGLAISEALALLLLTGLLKGKSSESKPKSVEVSQSND